MVILPTTLHYELQLKLLGDKYTIFLNKKMAANFFTAILNKNYKLKLLYYLWLNMYAIVPVIRTVPANNALSIFNNVTLELLDADWLFKDKMSIPKLAEMALECSNSMESLATTPW